MLSFITDKNLFINGTIKDSNRDFIVEEIPLYLPSGEGQHIYLLIKKDNLSTKDLVNKLRKLFSIAETDIGFAGLKDKNAITTQWVSLSLGATASLEETKSRIIENIEEVEVLKVSKHTNKLKNSHLIGNKFSIRVNGTPDNALEVCEKIRESLLRTGAPNYYGPQRFGSKRTNHIFGKEILFKEKKEKRHWIKKLMLSAYQSHLFNEWLDYRLKESKFNELLEGDLLLPIDGQRPFPFDSSKGHEVEFRNQMVTFTGPMFGSKVNSPTGLALEYEHKIYEREELSSELLKSAKLSGSRRASHIFLKELLIEQDSPTRLMFHFTLPKGSYATSLLREFLKESI